MTERVMEAVFIAMIVSGLAILAWDFLRRRIR